MCAQPQQFIPVCPYVVDIMGPGCLTAGSHTQPSPKFNNQGGSDPWRRRDVSRRLGTAAPQTGCSMGMDLASVSGCGLTDLLDTLH